MTGEHDTRDSNHTEGSSRHWTSPEDDLLLGRNAQRKTNRAGKLGNFVLFTYC